MCKSKCACAGSGETLENNTITYFFSFLGFANIHVSRAPPAWNLHDSFRIWAASSPLPSLRISRRKVRSFRALLLTSSSHWLDGSAPGGIPSSSSLFLNVANFGENVDFVPFLVRQEFTGLGMGWWWK
jgi:hypothetical protein